MMRCHFGKLKIVAFHNFILTCVPVLQLSAKSKQRCQICKILISRWLSKNHKYLLYFEEKIYQKIFNKYYCN